MNILKKFLTIFGGSEKEPNDGRPTLEPVVVPREEHILSRKNIDSDALKVLNRLNRFKHTTYLVGGGVRDLLLERKAKDFDVSTSAHPNEIKRLFRNCRLIGRRFRLAHILFRGKNIIEVSTFRRHAGFGDNGELLIKSDNTFGTPAEDALRRDFTVNGLFYNIADYSIIDYVGGLKDLEKKVIATIGEPGLRFQEDPIRMLRAIRFAARLDFSISPDSSAAIAKHRKEIWKAAPPRILEDLLRILQQGAAAESFRLLQEHKLLPILLPRLEKAFRKDDVREKILSNLEKLDGMARPKEGLSPAFLISALYYPVFEDAISDKPPETDRGRFARELLGEDLAKLNFPKMQFERSRQIIAAQNRLANLGRKKIRPAVLASKGYFREALALFELTQPASAATKSLLRRWRSIANKSGSEETGGKQGSRRSGGRRRRPYKGKRGAPAEGGKPTPEAAPEGSAGNGQSGHGKADSDSKPL